MTAGGKPKRQDGYVGRFAPSPTGPLHLGSLVAAVGSYLDARHHGGRWLVRMEDLDLPRLKPGSDADILRTLEHFGLTWDGAVEYQSQQTNRYSAALEALKSHGLTFECSCSRRGTANIGASGYPGTCRLGPTRPGPVAIRFRVPDKPDSQIVLADAIQGTCQFDLSKLGDVVILRRDGVFAYQLAVVVDDAHQGVTHVVRGADLLESTAWQIALQQSLQLPSPHYSHLPLVLDRKRGKLSKSRGSLGLEPARASAELSTALRLLQHSPPAELERESPREILRWARTAWDPKHIAGIRAVTDHTRSQV